MALPSPLEKALEQGRSGESHMFFLLLKGCLLEVGCWMLLFDLVSCWMSDVGYCWWLDVVGCLVGCLVGFLVGFLVGWLLGCLLVLVAVVVVVVVIVGCLRVGQASVDANVETF